MTTEEEIVDENTSNKIPDFNVIVGSETGLLKGVSINPKMCLAKNFLNMQHLERKHEITAMAWGNEDETEVLLGLRGHIIRSFNPDDKIFSSTIDFDKDCGKVVGIARCNDALVTACESGVIRVWSDPNEKVNTIDFELGCSGKLKSDNFKDEDCKQKHLVSLKVERALHVMRQVPNTNLIATGGKENDLQLWDVSNLKKGPLFRAKNVPHDNLELRVPVWLTDICFTDNQSANKIAVVSRYGHIRLYDTRGNQRRPVLAMEWPDEILTAASSTSTEHEIIVGSSTGFIAQYDLRMTHKGLRRKYRGCTGGIRSIDSHKSHNYFAAVGLDRFLRVFDINQPKPVQKIYLKSRLNHVLLSKKFEPTALPQPCTKTKTQKKKISVENSTKEDGDEFWAKLPVIRSSDGKKKAKRGYVDKSAKSDDMSSNVKKARK